MVFAVMLRVKSAKCVLLWYRLITLCQQVNDQLIQVHKSSSLNSITVIFAYNMAIVYVYVYHVHLIRRYHRSSRCHYVKHRLTE